MTIFETFECSGQILSNSLCQFLNDKLIPVQILVSLFSFMKDNSSVFFNSNNIHFAQKENIKMKILKTFKCSGENSSNSSCQFWNEKSIPLQILHHSSSSWHITLLWIFKLILFLLWSKGSHQYPIFETFNYSGENLPYSLCHFPNHKAVFLQILFHPSVSWKITPRYFFRSNIKYFAHF